MTVRAVFFPDTHMSLFFLERKMTRVTLGIKAGAYPDEEPVAPRYQGWLDFY
jgi:hypothetical protein